MEKIFFNSFSDFFPYVLRIVLNFFAKLFSIAKKKKN